MRYTRCPLVEETTKSEVPPIMMTINTIFTLNDEVQPAILLEALHDMLKLYPVFGFVFEQEGDKIYLVDCDDPVSLYETDKIIVPYTANIGKHRFAVGYSGQNIYISVDHRLSDGAGVQLFFGKMLERYGRLLDGTAEEISGPAYDISLMYQQLPVLPEGDFKQYKQYIAKGEMIKLPDSSVGSLYRLFTCQISEEAFMDYVKSREITALAAISQIVGRGIFNIYPEKEDFIRIAFVISSKKVLKMEKSFADSLDFGIVDIPRDEIDNTDCLKRVSADIKGQITDENIIYDALHDGGEKMEIFTSRATFACSYLRLNNANQDFIKKHQSVPLCFSPVPKVDVRTIGGIMEFTVAGLPGCETLYNAVKQGLELSGFNPVSEEIQQVVIENDTLAVI